MDASTLELLVLLVDQEPTARLSFTEGFDTRDSREARALLEEL